MGKKRHALGPSSRPVQVGEQIRQAIQQALLEGAIKDARLVDGPMITVTEVRMAPDLRFGRVLVSVFPDDDESVVAGVFSALEQKKGRLKREIASRLRLRFTPDLRFEPDGSIAYGAKIEALLRELRVSEGDEEGAAEDEPS